MRKHCAENEGVKREYLAWLRNAGGRDDATLDLAAAAIHRFEAFHRYANFKTFRRERAISYKAHLAEQTHPKTGKPLSKATLHSHLSALKVFFEWLSREPGYRKTVHHADAAYFNLTANDARVATARREKPSPSLDQVIHVLETMPADSAIRRRDRAVVAFILLTGARDGAAASLRIKHVSLSKRQVFQDPREVKTKRAKTFMSDFFPVGELPLQIVTDWIAEMTSAHLFGPDDPLFPASARTLDAAGHFEASGLTRTPWSSAAPIRSIFRRAFETAGLESYGPHSLRKTLQRLAYDQDLSPRELKAWSQCLGHDSVLTTLTSYGQLPVDEQSRVMARLANRKLGESDSDEAAVRQVLAALRLVKGA